MQLHAACCAVSIWGTVDKGMQSQLCLPLPTPMGDRKCYCFKACCKARVWYMTASAWHCGWGGVNGAAGHKRRGASMCSTVG